MQIWFMNPWKGLGRVNWKQMGGWFQGIGKNKQNFRERKKTERLLSRENPKCVDVSKGTETHFWQHWPQRSRRSYAEFRNTDQEQELGEGWAEPTGTKKKRGNCAFRRRCIQAHCNGWWRLQASAIPWKSNGGCPLIHLSEWIIARLSLKWCYTHLEVADHWTSRVPVINSLPSGG